MPTSRLAMWPEILRLAGTVEPKMVLDVGPGWGKAAVLLREYVPSVRYIHAVEAHAPYISEHGLKGLYNAVISSHFEEMSASDVGHYDLVLMADVLEHVEEGLAVPALQRVARHLLVCTPDVFSQTWVPGLPETERHVSLWTPAMVEDVGFDAVEVVHQYEGWIGLFRRQAG